MKASIKFKFRESSIPHSEGSIVLQIIYCRIAKTHTLDYRVYSSEWDSGKQCPIILTETPSQRVKYLMQIKSRLEKDRKQVQRGLELLKLRGDFSSEDILNHFLKKDRYGMLVPYVQKKIENLKNQKRLGTAHILSGALNSFLLFTNGRDIKMDEIDRFLLRRYELFMKNRNRHHNTIACYLRYLRASYNDAIGENIINRKEYCPFEGVNTAVGKSEKRAISKQDIENLMKFDFSLSDSKWDLARDLFIFSFCTRGMPFVDMAFLKKEDLSNGFIIYRRQKTGQRLQVKILPIVDKIIKKYKDQTQTSPYLLPIILAEEKDKWLQYQTGMRIYNNRLKRISKALGLSVSLTGYVARHSWASIARFKGIPISLISEGMGHTSEKTTHIYLSSFSHEEIDKANAKICMF